MFPFSLSGTAVISDSAMSPESTVERVQVWLELEGAGVARTEGRLAFQFPFLLRRYGASASSALWMVDAGDIRAARGSGGIRVEFELRLVQSLGFISLVLAGTFLVWSLLNASLLDLTLFILLGWGAVFGLNAVMTASRFRSLVIRAAGPGRKIDRR